MAQYFYCFEPKISRVYVANSFEIFLTQRKIDEKTKRQCFHTKCDHWLNISNHFKTLSLWKFLLNVKLYQSVHLSKTETAIVFRDLLFVLSFSLTVSFAPLLSHRLIHSISRLYILIAYNFVHTLSLSTHSDSFAAE